MTGSNPHRTAARALVHEIEGHLLVAAAREEGRAAAARFSASLDLLMGHQLRQVEDRFEAEYLALTRASWQRTAERAGRLRGEYEERYRALRRRLLAGCLVGWCAVLGCVGTLILGRA